MGDEVVLRLSLDDDGRRENLTVERSSRPAFGRLPQFDFDALNPCKHMIDFGFHHLGRQLDDNVG